MSSNTSKIAAMAALSMVLTPASAPFAKTEDGSPRDGTKITASINWESEEIFYSAITDDALEVMAAAKRFSVGTCAGCQTPVKKPTSAPSAPKSQRGK
jgi:hypothetical protein